MLCAILWVPGIKQDAEETKESGIKDITIQY